MCAEECSNIHLDRKEEWNDDTLFEVEVKPGSSAVIFKSLNYSRKYIDVPHNHGGIIGESPHDVAILQAIEVA